MGTLFEGFNQFINWVPRPKQNGKIDKVPVGPCGLNVNAQDPGNWMSLAEANARAAQMGAGVGFVFTKNDPFFFVDVDDASEGTSWSPLAKTILSAFPGCAVEVSYSGKGFHIFGIAQAPAHSYEAKGVGGFYTEKRFVALTGTSATGDSMTNGQIGVNWLVSNYFPPRSTPKTSEWTSAPVPEWCGPDDDDTLIKKAKRAKSMSATFNGGARFIDLFNGDAERLSKSYPSNNNVDPYGYSEADAALCSHLAFYTGKDCDRIERIFNLSELGKRDKWINREDYRRRTIEGAVAICKSVYNVPPPPDPIGAPPDPIGAPPAPTPDGDESETRTGNQFLDLHAQMEHFAGCVYVMSRHRVLVPKNGLLKPEQFRATYGGYDFAINWSGKPTRNPFEALTESQLYTFPKAYGTCFRPETPPGTLVREEGRLFVNTYSPVEVARRPGDVSPFLDLLQRMLPDERDRGILMAYMAGCVQHRGSKFQWAPLLQGAPGNGKTFLASAISKAVGERYSHFPNASDLKGNGLKFTGWMYEKLFIGIEDLFPDGRMDVQEALKDKITNRRIEFQEKGVSQFMGDNRANFLFCVNPKDAILKTKNDRRFCIFFTAQQSEADIINSGMGGTYFPDLYNWARREGYAYITDYLIRYQIPAEFDPSGSCHRAPRTSSTKEALSLSVSGVEQEIMEAVNEGRSGFRGGWISSVALGNLLTGGGYLMARNKRRSLLEGLGYVLKERLNNPSAVDGGKKALLYVLNKPELINIPRGLATATAYANAQQGSPALHAVG